MANPVIIRLQNLPLEARSIDIRKFFDGLLIPDGGVHIIGGEKGIAFIAFQSDEDARLAMARDGGTIFNTPVRLYLSSKTEMQNVIASARNPQAPVAAAAVAPSLPFNLSSALPELRSNNLDIITSLASLITSTAKSGGGSGGGVGQSLLYESQDVKSSASELFKGLVDKEAKPKDEAAMAQTPLSVDQILNLIQNRIQTEQPKLLASNEATSSGVDRNGAGTVNEARRAYNERGDEAKRNAAEAFSTDTYSPGGGRDYESKQGGRYAQGGDFGDRQRPFFKGNQGGGGGQFGNKNGNYYDNGKPNKRFNQGGPYSGGPGGGEYDDSNKGFPRAKGRLDPIILVKNFSRNSGYKDIRTFLQGIQIEHDGIKLLTDSTGHRIGMALVKLMTIVDLKKALCRNGQFYDDSLIEVLQSSEEEFSNPPLNKFTPSKPTKDGPGAGFNPYDKRGRMNDYYSRSDDNLNRGDAEDLSAHGFFLKIYGLPAKFDESALKNIFNNVKFLQIYTTTPIAFKSNNPADGEPKTTFKAKKICEVETLLDLEKALTRQDERVGKSKLQIFQISKGEFDRELANAQKNPNFNELQGDDEEYNEPADGEKNDNTSNDNQSPTSSAAAAVTNAEDAFLHMTGVPFSAHEMDVKTFFQGLNLGRITILHDTQTCKPTGEVCCSFTSKQDRDKGLEKDNQLFRNRVVKIRPVELAEYQKYVNQEQEVKGKMKSKPFHNQDDQGYYKKNYNDFGGNNYGNNAKFGNKNGSFQNFNQNYQYNKFRPNPNNGGGPNKSNFNDFNRLKRRDTDAYSDDRNGNFAAKRIKESNHEIAVVDLPPLPPELEQHRDSLVLLNNVTHEATREDILDLFKIYSPIEQSLKIRHNEDGEPTGDVIIACKTPANANKACRFLNGYAFMGRPIKASLIAS